MIYPFYSHTSGPGAYMSNFYKSLYVIPMDELIDYLTPVVPEDTLRYLIGLNMDTLQMYSSEQGFMMIKCLVFMHENLTKNQNIFNDILTEQNPAVCKSLGRGVKGYNERIWNDVRISAMTINLMWKFKQNPSLRAKLLATVDQTLVEASPKDRIWGVGLSINNPKINDPKCWKGTNLLGKCLMDVRFKLSYSPKTKVKALRL